MIKIKIKKVKSLKMFNYACNISIYEIMRSLIFDTKYLQYFNGNQRDKMLHLIMDVVQRYLQDTPSSNMQLKSR